MGIQDVSQQTDTTGQIVCLCVAIVFSVLRTGARWYKIRGFPREAEDLFMYLALVSYIIMSGLYFGILPTLFRLYAVAAGLVPPWATMAEDVTAMLKLIFVVQFFFWLTLWCVKWSLLFMFKKTTTGLPLYHKIWWGILAFSIVTFIICCISNFTTCSSMAKWFSAKSECATHRDNVAKRISLWFSLAVDLLTDLMIMVTPVHVILTLKMSWTEKISLALIFVVGIITMVTAIIRSVSLDPGAGTSDVSVTWVILWGGIEAAVAIAVGCLPSFAIFLRGRVAASRGTDKSNSKNTSSKIGSKMNSSSHFSRSRKMPGSVPIEDEHDIWHGGDAASNKSLVRENNEGITVTQTWRTDWQLSDEESAQKAMGRQYGIELINRMSP